MIDPAPALVRPRVVGRDGEIRPLEDVIDRLLSQGGKGIVLLVGPPGSGKTTALRHVAARLTLRNGTGDRCRIVDTAEFPSMDPEAKGDIDWENADLRFANLNGATFHMGSSRGGLVFSPFACEGSKTGFYTDELHEQHFKAPEEIRKANLRGADLRGAFLGAVDFYLVDLRNAKMDPEQMDYARNCGAILNDWGE